MEHELRITPNSVEFWSNRRLPYPDKSEAPGIGEARRLVANALRELRGSELHASYAEAPGSKQLADLENTLLYNVVGETVIPHGAVRLVLVREATILDSPSGRPWKCNWRYETRARAGSGWATTDSLVRFSLQGAGRLPSDRVEFWRAAQKSRPDCLPCDPDVELGISLVLRADGKTNLGKAIKPVIDGVLSALHSYEGNQLPEICRRLAMRYPTAHIDANWWTRPGILGASRFVWPRANDLQWSPHDGRLVRIDMSLDQSDSPNWSLDLELFEMVRAGSRGR